MTALRFGLNALNQLTTWEEYLRLCQTAEEMGFDSFWAFDHLLVGPATSEGPVLDMFTTLAALAVSTKRITLGTLIVSATFRHPAFVAKMATQLDILSGGRVVLGLGAGAYRLEHDVFGVEFPPPGERVDRLIETVRIIRSLWTEPSTTFEGKYYSLKEAVLDPPPVQRPHPPILIAAQSNRMVRLAAEHADNHNAGTRSPDQVKAMNALVDATCLSQGRDPNSVVRSAVVLNGLAEGGHQEAVDRQFSKLFNSPVGAFADRMLRGSDEEAEETLRAYLDAGVSEFMFTMAAPFNYGSLRRLAGFIARFR
jgi:alkanesulfonate monooxygenase SsuD/methylene tetrahydromethanopterin reductase-like flavin-dependent oxidoreductase (luciferase family)